MTQAFTSQNTYKKKRDINNNDNMNKNNTITLTIINGK